MNELPVPLDPCFFKQKKTMVIELTLYS